MPNSRGCYISMWIWGCLQLPQGAQMQASFLFLLLFYKPFETHCHSHFLGLWCVLNGINSSSEGPLNIAPICCQAVSYHSSPTYRWLPYTHRGGKAVGTRGRRVLCEALSLCRSIEKLVVKRDSRASKNTDRCPDSSTLPFVGWRNGSAIQLPVSILEGTQVFVTTVPGNLKPLVSATVHLYTFTFMYMPPQGHAHLHK